MADKKRLFLAVCPSIATTRKVADAITRMRTVADRKRMRVGWVPPANLHVTLKFLGWASGDVVTAVRDRVARIVAGLGPFELAVRGAGAFPRVSSARVLWVGVQDPSGELARVAGEIDASMATLGFAREERPFAAHVTIGRVKEGGSAEDVLAPVLATDFGTSLVREVVLYESLMRSTGSEYIALGRIPLEGSPRGPERQTRTVQTGPESEDPNGGEP